MAPVEHLYITHLSGPGARAEVRFRKGQEVKEGMMEPKQQSKPENREMGLGPNTWMRI